MIKAMHQFRTANRQTQVFVIMTAIYIIALVWTTVQSYARLEYSRTGNPKPIEISIENT